MTPTPPQRPVYQPSVTLEDVLAAKPTTIWYGSNTTWWTHDPAHLHGLPRQQPTVVGGALQFSSAPQVLSPAEAREAGGCLPCDPAGGVLFQTDDVRGFLEAARKEPGHYGRHGLVAFMAAHAANCRNAQGGPAAFGTWVDANAAVEAYVAGWRERG